MSPDDYAEEARRWLRYAAEDLRTAELLIDQEDYVPRNACWHAQQSAEKALKAVLVFLHIDVPRSHNLDRLRNLIPLDWPLKAEHPDLVELTEWAVEARYPGDSPDATEDDAQAAVRQARAVLHSVRRDLIAHGFPSD